MSTSIFVRFNRTKMIGQRLKGLTEPSGEVPFMGLAVETAHSRKNEGASPQLYFSAVSCLLLSCIPSGIPYTPDSIDPLRRADLQLHGRRILGTKQGLRTSA